MRNTFSALTLIVEHNCDTVADTFDSVELNVMT